MRNASAYFAIVGVILVIIGLFCLVRGEATVGIRGLTKHVSGLWAFLIGGVYCAAGVLLIGTLAMTSTDAIPIQFGTVFAVLVVSIIGYFLGE